MSRRVTSTLAVLTLCLAVPVFAQGAEPNLTMGADLVPAPFGYEAAPGKYVTAKATDLYISPYIWGGKVMGAHLNAGQPVEVLAKAKDYDWLIVGRNGMPLGYVPQTALSPAKN